jgi:alkylated DNA nucleotide flippase Atl1
VTDERAHPDDFGARVIEFVDTIPEGRVMTYGDVAATLGSKASRAVGQAMAYSGGTAPWWRVLRAGGLPPRGHEQQALEHYRAEGTPVRLSPGGGYRVDLAAARWTPEESGTE